MALPVSFLVPGAHPRAGILSHYARPAPQGWHLGCKVMKSEFQSYNVQMTCCSQAPDKNARPRAPPAA